MKGKIDKNGILHLKKTRGWVRQTCPFANTGIDSHIARGCGDWCPLFGEVVMDSMGSYLTLCKTVIRIDTTYIK